ncbi:methylmalonate-semialdehyde dehydrogenase [Colletotrichum truncatum]|uniref:Methylmalonate-semialdehyde dehydrogenase n=1 Tax=Colletotrichum truncatum TaxID=5467 RepID=A0ACC3YL38_COLTU|nr:methylmalonate-semialdehyde dehydrogenase [Colletotrichum truncatum]KAF6797155.1 methylmalonate-semialdehyde dehydrogenase [Colletotrichum truncatum]
MRSLESTSGIRSLRKTTIIPATAVHFSSSTKTQNRTRPWVHVKKRPAEPQVPSRWRPFEVPEVLLDLDSWGSNYTRPYDEAEHKAQREKWASNPRREATFKRVTKFDNDLKEAKYSIAKINRDKSWQPWRVTDLDVMSAALKGTPKHTEYGTSNIKSAQHSVIQKNGIPASVFQEDKRLLEWLLHRRFSTPQRQPNGTQLSQRLEQPTTVADFRRLVSSLLLSTESTRLLFSNKDKIATLLSDMLERRVAQSTLLLPTLNSLLIQCQSNGYTLGAPLWSVCMRVSAQAFRLRALKMYIDYGFVQGYGHDDLAATKEVLRLLSRLVQRLRGHLQNKLNDDPRKAHDIDAHQDTFAQSISRYYPAPKQLLLLLLGEGSSKPSLKKVVEQNFADNELTHLYQQLVGEINLLPDDATRHSDEGTKETFHAI